MIERHIDKLWDDAKARADGFFEDHSRELDSAFKKNILLSFCENEVAGCRRCQLNETRTNTVFGNGNSMAELMVIGEGPGQTEDEQGIPFVGKAGQLFDKILEAMGLNRQKIYITNIVKCRPPGNRNPEDSEIKACWDYLDEQIAIVNPRIIMTLGSPATKALLQTDAGITRLRGKFHEYKGIPVLPTYHPSYLLRDPSHKKETWEDVQRVMVFLKE